MIPEPTKLILIGSRTSNQATGDALRVGHAGGLPVRAYYYTLENTNDKEEKEKKNTPQTFEEKAENILFLRKTRREARPARNEGNLGVEAEGAKRESELVRQIEPARGATRARTLRERRNSPRRLLFVRKKRMAYCTVTNTPSIIEG